MFIRSLLLSAGLIATSAHAHVVTGSAGLTHLQVLDRNTGEVLPVYWYQGRRYIAGTPGNRYAVALHNRSGGRVLTVLAVDGVNAVTGETAAWDQNGYVFSPGQRWEVRGWRKSQERIAAFEFTALPNSYAARTGRPQNVGVIGVAVFREALRVVPQPWPAPDVSGARQRNDGSDGAAGESSANSADSVAGAPQAEMRSESARRAAPSAAPLESTRVEREQKLGTGHGRSEHSWVSYTDFQRAHRSPDEVITLYYDSRENLIAMGVIPPSPAPMPSPTPFPGSRFVPDPPR